MRSRCSKPKIWAFSTTDQKINHPVNRACPERIPRFPTWNRDKNRHYPHGFASSPQTAAVHVESQDNPKSRSVSMQYTLSLPRHLKSGRIGQIPKTTASKLRYFSLAIARILYKPLCFNESHTSLGPKTYPNKIILPPTTNSD